MERKTGKRKRDFSKSYLLITMDDLLHLLETYVELVERYGKEEALTRLIMNNERGEEEMV